MSGAGSRKSVEAALEPDLPIIDTHHHLFDYKGVRYLFDEIREDVNSGHSIRATVYVESRSMARGSGPEKFRPVGETEFAAGVAAMFATGRYGPANVCAAIVGFADLGLGAEVEEVLDAHEAAGGGRFRGIRQGSYWDEDETLFGMVSMRPPPGLLLDTGFREGFRRLTARGHSFDAVLFHPQIGELADLARRFPDGRIILNHMGFPLGVGRYAGRRDEVFAAWRQSMSGLAQCGNVFVKAGGLGVPLWGLGFDRRETPASSAELAEAWRPYIEETIALFGAGRCMFESNFPADRPSAGYVELWNALKRITASYSADERAALFHRTAAHAYRIGI